MLQSLAAEHGGQGFQWKINPEDMDQLWNARHNAYFAAHSLVPGAKVLVTDICVPISRLAECITETKNNLAQVSDLYRGFESVPLRQQVLSAEKCSRPFS